VNAFSPWQARIYDQACAALAAGRLGHGLLLCGPADLGKRAVADALARRVLCEARGPLDEACGRCRSCMLARAGTHPDFHLVSFGPKKEGTKLRTEIVIDQIRRLSEQLALTPQYGRAQVALIDPADAVNHAACNALLKTLEEPVDGRYLWLVSANPARLPATVRSRCQRLEFRQPPRDEALAWLATAGHDTKTATEALDAARGHPGLANRWLQGEGMALRREVAEQLSKLSRSELAPAEVAQRWTADEHAALRLEHAADLAVADAARLTDPQRTRRLAHWFDQANRTRDLLRTTVRADLAVMELLIAWRALGASQHSSGAAAGVRRR